MAYYRECPYCGVNLDPGELCECRSERKKEAASTHMETTSREIRSAVIVLHGSARVKEVMR